MRFVAPSLALAVLLGASSAAAQDEAPPAAAAAPKERSVDEERSAWLDSQLAQIEPATERWYTGWTWGFAWLSIGNAGLALATQATPQREFAAVSSVEGLLGLTSVLIQPNSLRHMRDTLDQYDTSATLGQYERRRRAEYMLYGTASEEKYWRSPVPHILGLVAGGAAGTVLIAGYKQTEFGIASMALGLAVVEIQIWSRPTSATKAWHEYARVYHANNPIEVGPDQIDMFSVSLAPTPGGLAAVGTF